MSDAPRKAHPRLGPTVPGWVVVGARDPGGMRHPVVVDNGRSIMHSAIVGNHIDVAESDVGASAYEELGPDQARAHRIADATAAQAAVAAHVDMFITRRPYLHAVTWALAGGVLISSPE